MKPWFKLTINNSAFGLVRTSLSIFLLRNLETFENYISKPSQHSLIPSITISLISNKMNIQYQLNYFLVILFLANYSSFSGRSHTVSILAAKFSALHSNRGQDKKEQCHIRYLPRYIYFNSRYIYFNSRYI